MLFLVVSVHEFNYYSNYIQKYKTGSFFLDLSLLLANYKGRNSHRKCGPVHFPGALRSCGCAMTLIASRSECILSRRNSFFPEVTDIPKKCPFLPHF